MKKNGVDFVKAGKLTMKGPNSGKMIWVYLLIILLIAILLIALIAFIMAYWNKIISQYQGINANQGDEPHTTNKHLKYLIQNNPDDNNPIGGDGFNNYP